MLNVFCEFALENTAVLACVFLLSTILAFTLRGDMLLKGESGETHTPVLHGVWLFTVCLAITSGFPVAVATVIRLFPV